MVQENRIRQKLGTYLCMLAVCLGVLLSKTEVVAATNEQVALVVSQTLDIKSKGLPDSEQEFTYILEALESNNPLPLGNVDGTYSFSLKGNQKIKLEGIVFTEIGEYHYQLRLKEIKVNKEFTCDQEVYKITVYVTESVGGVRADITVADKEGLKSEKLEFTHTYEKPEDKQPDIKPTGVSEMINQTGKIALGAKTGDTTPILLFLGMVSLAGIATVALFIVRQRKKGEL